MSKKPHVRTGIVGSGFSATFHFEALSKVNAVDVDVVGVYSLDAAGGRRYAQQRDIRFFESLEALLEEVDVIHVCTPPYGHEPISIAGLRRDKFVVCEKPLTGYFGEDRPKDGLVGKTVSRQRMLEHVIARCDEVMDAVKASGTKFGYAENWVYAPSYVKLWRLAKTAQGTILRIEAEESHSGSHADYAKQWRTSGGGSLMVKGSHPLGAALQLKHWEGEAKSGKPIRPASVFCEVGHLTWIAEFEKEKKRYLRTGWKDVEDWGIIIVKFDDGSVAEVKAADTTLGGVHNYLEAYLSNARLRANINPTDACVAYAPEADIFGDEYIVEKIETKGGWSLPSPDEDWNQGYPQEIADFVAAVAEDRQPVSGARLARDVTIVLYAAYVSAEEGRRVDVRSLLG